MRGLLERMILPIIAAQAVRFFFKTPSTSCNRLGGTQSNKPPLVCASASRRRTDSGVLFHSTMAFAVSRFCLVPPGTQSCAMSEKTWRLITGTFAGTISAPTPLARHIEERCPSSPNPVTSTAARIKPSSASSAPTMFSWHMSVMDFLISAALVSPRLIPVVAIPVPRGFVKRRRSPAPAREFVSMRLGDTIPVTASP